MNSLFGDATTIAPTPETLAEVESLFSGNRSPVPSFRLGDEANGEADGISEIDVQPPHVEIEDGKPLLTGKDQEGEGEGVAGWISNMVKRTKGEEQNGSGKYKKVGQDEGQR